MGKVPVVQLAEIRGPKQLKIVRRLIDQHRRP